MYIVKSLITMTKDTLPKVGREGSQFYLIPRPDIWPGNEARPIWDQTFATKHSYININIQVIWSLYTSIFQGSLTRRKMLPQYGGWSLPPTQSKSWTRRRFECWCGRMSSRGDISTTPSSFPLSGARVSSTTWSATSTSSVARQGPRSKVWVGCAPILHAHIAIRLLASLVKNYILHKALFPLTCNNIFCHVDNSI